MCVMNGEKFLKAEARWDHPISFSWPCISHRAALTFLSYTSGVNYRAHRLSRAKLHPSLTPRYHSLTYPTCSAKAAEHMCRHFFLCVATSETIRGQISDILGTWFVYWQRALRLEAVKTQEISVYSLASVLWQMWHSKPLLRSQKGKCWILNIFRAGRVDWGSIHLCCGPQGSSGTHWFFLRGTKEKNNKISSFKRILVINTHPCLEVNRLSTIIKKTKCCFLGFQNKVLVVLGVVSFCLGTDTHSTARWSHQAHVTIIHQALWYSNWRSCHWAALRNIWFRSAGESSSPRLTPPIWFDESGQHGLLHYASKKRKVSKHKLNGRVEISWP